MSAADYYNSGSKGSKTHSSYHAPQQPQYTGAPPAYQQYPAGQQPQEGEKGFLATALGGAAGGAAAHHYGKSSKLKTALGAVGGAVALNVIEHKLKGRHGHQQDHHQHHHGGHHGHHQGGSAGLLGGLVTSTTAVRSRLVGTNIITTTSLNLPLEALGVVIMAITGTTMGIMDTTEEASADGKS
ncbi:hypothetical protein M406DRAFT_328135 [Cryphonectria parasitica EP155]|uniref:Glycine zipper 2TM domain-containing protein n=1 Tax=Cryphonectria parasitica (strain ATCC 38755 / EP155) TaxID=660469 RepID=A0A9P4Y6J4_CRYP1|nr:uncharacterized protein M406DRAFT_328135 [Cryphonectria parasitica EP155]KAF3767025.1 hypothetical protein M406DRAFT_328135 [Cryphonectria parasitica EP155]